MVWLPIWPQYVANLSSKSIYKVMKRRRKMARLPILIRNQEWSLEQPVKTYYKWSGYQSNRNRWEWTKKKMARLPISVLNQEKAWNKETLRWPDCQSHSTHMHFIIDGQTANLCTAPIILLNRTVDASWSNLKNKQKTKKWPGCHISLNHNKKILSLPSLILCLMEKIPIDLASHFNSLVICEVEHILTFLLTPVLKPVLGGRFAVSCKFSNSKCMELGHFYTCFRV